MASDTYIAVCESCSYEFDSKELLQRCPSCGSKRVDWQQFDDPTFRSYDDGE